MRLLRSTPAAGALLSLVACGGSAPTAAAPAAASPSKAVTVYGTVTVSGTIQPGDTAPRCEADRGFDDIKTGAQAVLTSDHGDTLAVTTLSDQDVYSNDVVVGATASCTFAMNFGQVPQPAQSQFFKLVVGHRSPYTLTPTTLYGFRLTL